MSGNNNPCLAEQLNSIAITRMVLLTEEEHLHDQHQTCVTTNDTLATLAKHSSMRVKIPKDIAAKSVKPNNGHVTPRGKTPEVSSQVKNQNSSLDQERKISLLGFGLVAIVAVGILFLLVFAYLGFVTFSSLATSPGLTQQEGRTGVSETLCQKIKAVNSSMSDSIRPVFGTIQYECQEVQTSGTSEDISQETNPYALVKDTCCVHFYDPDTEKELEGIVPLGSGYLRFSLCGIWNLPWNFVKSITLMLASHIEKTYVEPVTTRIKEAIKPLFRLIVLRTRTDFEYDVKPFSDQHLCFQFTFASVFLVPLIITKWLCWDKRQFSPRLRIIRWLCDLLLLLFGCWCVGSACYDWIGSASVNALRQHTEAEANEVGNMIDLGLLNNLQFENRTLTKEAFRFASVRKDAEASELLDKKFARFAGSKDASILNKDQFEKFKQYAADVKLQTQWSLVNTWNWLWSKDFKDGVCALVNDSMEWVVKKAALYFWYCFLTKIFADGFAIFNTFAQHTPNAKLKVFAQATRLFSDNVSGSTQTTLEVALQVSNRVGQWLKFVVLSAAVAFASLAFYMAMRTAYAKTICLLCDVITTTPQWWCAYYYIDGFAFALLKQYYRCVLLHGDSSETQAIVKAENNIATVDKIIANTTEGTSNEALRNRTEKFAFLQMFVEYGVLKIPMQPILYEYFLCFVFEALEMLEAEEEKFANEKDLAFSKLKSKLQKRAIDRSGVNEHETLENIFPDIEFDSECQVFPEILSRTRRGRGLKPGNERRLADLQLQDLPCVMKTDHVDPEVRRALEESGVTNPHWACVDYLQRLLKMFHELKRIDAFENVNNNLLWQNFGRFWSTRVDELCCIIQRRLKRGCHDQ